MIVIGKPELKEDGDKVFLSINLKTGGGSQNLWYSFPIKFKKYLLTERLDAFVVGLLFLGLKTGENIKLEGAISAKLFYSLQHYLIDALCLSNPDFKKIQILPESIDASDLNVGECAGTGLSCGVDSFATYYDHLDEKGPYKVEYFTFFNVGSHGDMGGERARNVYYKRLNAVKEFADTIDKGIISIDSNLSEVLKMNFLQTNTLRNISCVLHLQKLFRNYYIASKNRFDYYKLHAFNNQDYDTLTLSLFSTESTSFYSAVSQMTRVERTNYISEFQSSWRYLDVCTDPNKSTNRNCSSCDKCLRTALTLDLLGKLERYKEVFDLSIYRKKKDAYIGKVIATRHIDHFNEEIFDLMNDHNSITIKDYLNSIKFRFEENKRNLKKGLKSQLRMV